MLLAIAATSKAATGPTDSAGRSTPPAVVSTNILAKIYQSANARLSRGDLDGAIAALNLVVDVGPGISEAQFSRALAALLRDFSKRSDLLPTIRQVSQADPNNPLERMLLVFADPAMSTLRPDGGLYVTAAGASALKAVANQLPGYTAARNGAYIQAFLNSAQPTGDPTFPARYANFNRMVGPGGSLQLPQWASAVVFGQLFVLTVDDRRFAPYEAALIARLQDGLKSLQNNQASLSQMRVRIQELRAQLETADPTQRMVAISNLDQLLNELDGVIASNDQTVSQLQVIVSNVDAKADVQIAANQKTIKDQQDQIASLRKLSQSLEAETQSKKQALSAAQQHYFDTVKKINTAQNDLNGLQTRLAEAQTRLQDSQQTTSGLEHSVQQRTAQIDQIQAQADSLRAAQEAATRLDQLKQQQSTASAQLAQIQSDVKAAQAAKQGDLAALQQQQNDMQAKLATLSSSIQAGEQAQAKADDTKRQLDALLTQKQTLETDMQSEQGKLAAVKSERDRLQQQVASIQAQQDQGLADQARLASALQQVDFGRYYALIIGDDEYQQWPRLATAVNDARDLADMLSRKYNFQVQLLTNATRSQILGALDGYVSKLGPQDNLLVYFAGHGILENDVGYWVPVDAAAATGNAGNTAGLIRHDEIIAKLQQMKNAKQVMVVADSCFSGGLAAAANEPRAQNAAYRMPPGVRTRGLKIVDQDGDIPVGSIQGTVAKADLPPDQMNALYHWSELQARVVLTSGGLEPVPDQMKPGDRHSIFASAVLSTLGNNKGVLRSLELTSAVQEQVVKSAGGATARGGNAATLGSQTPTYNNLMGYSGDFLFVARN